VLTGVAFCPHPPVLVPDVARGAAPELDGLRAACRVALERASAGASRLVVLGSAARTAQHGPTARGSLAGFGVPLEVPLGSEDPGPVELPLSLTIGAWLLREYLGPGSGAIGWSAGDEPVDPAELRGTEPTALLVMGDGSARRSTAAPGYFDPRAEAFDRGIGEALRSGDGAALRVDGAEGLLVAGTNAWAAASYAVEDRRWDAEVMYEDAPYGVGYFVAAWT
jgi:hypothetical protein